MESHLPKGKFKPEERKDAVKLLSFRISELGNKAPLTEKQFAASKKAISKLTQLGEYESLEILCRFETVSERIAKESVYALEKSHMTSSLADVCKRAPEQVAKEAVSALGRLKELDWLHQICEVASLPIAKEAVSVLERLDARVTLNSVASFIANSNGSVAEFAKEAVERLEGTDKLAEEIKEIVAKL